MNDHLSEGLSLLFFAIGFIAMVAAAPMLLRSSASEHTHDGLPCHLRGAIALLLAPNGLSTEPTLNPSVFQDLTLLSALSVGQVADTNALGDGQMLAC